MKIVLDTNVFISGIFFSGPPAQILKAWKDQEFQIVISKEILSEYQRVAHDLSIKFLGVDIGPIIELLTIYGRIVETEGISVTVCEDPDDNMFLECAIASNSKIIVSGDRHLLRVSGYQGINVVKPRNFIDDLL